MIYFIRHGETISNAKEIITGITEVRLSVKGIEQAFAVKEVLESKKIDVCFCSPLQRTKHTCNIVCKDRNIKIKYDDRIKARNYGEFEGVKYSIANGQINWNVMKKEANTGCEPILKMVDRVFEFINYLKENYYDKNILIISHSSVGKIFNCYFNGFPKDGNIFYKKFKNAEVIAFEFEN